MRKFSTVIIGGFLIVLGVVSIVLDQVSYTRRDKVIDIGPLEASIEREAQGYGLPIIFGVLVIASGVALVILDRRKKKK